MHNIWGRLKLGLFGGTVLVLLLAGCDQAANNPYPQDDKTANTLYMGYNETPNHLDPARSYSTNEVRYTAQIYEPPFQYHYLKRPYELIPLAATAVPEPLLLDENGFILPPNADEAVVATSVWTVSIQPGRYYQPHPAFAVDSQGDYRYQQLSFADVLGVESPMDFSYMGTRELTAQDYVYQIKRLADPAVASPIYSLMAAHIQGFTEFAREAATQHALLEHDAETAADAFLDLRTIHLVGVKALDRYTFEIRLNGLYPQFKYWLAMPFFAPMPVEALRFYHQDALIDRDITIDTFPVGTGPYMMTKNRPSKSIVLEQNPNFAGEAYPSEGEDEDKANGLLDDAGQTMPFINKVVYSLEPESIPYWNKFLQGYYDISGISSESFDQVISFAGGSQAELAPDMRERGIRLQTAVAPSVFYLGFNMRDDVVGGYTPQARRLRRAISIAIDYDEYIRIFLNGRGVPAQGPLPPQIFGHEDDDYNRFVFDKLDGQLTRRAIGDAKQLLADAGYPGGINPKTGRRLTVNLDITGTGPGANAQLAWYRKQLEKLNIRLVIRSTTYNRLQRKMSNGDVQLYSLGWLADYPDPENFLFLLYGPNGKVDYGGENTSNFNNRNFNYLYKQMRSLPNGQRRRDVIHKMLEITRRDAPWVWGFYPQNYDLHHSWLKNRKLNPMANNTIKYLRLDTQARADYRRQENQPMVWPLGLGLIVLLAAIFPALWRYRRWQHRKAG